MTKRSSRDRSEKSGRMLRPNAEVLSDAALVPDQHLIKPPPTHFTHEVVTSQPYYYGKEHDTPAGEFSAGTRVVLMSYDGGTYCRVVDEQGLYVETAHDGLRSL